MFQERIEFINRLAVEAGQLTLAGFGKCDQMPKDGQEYDIATEYDLKSERLVRERIAEAFGEPVLGEEGGLLGDPEVARHHVWIVDPIDGTFNYQRGVPTYAVSIAYCQEGVPVCGAVYLPVLGRLYYAAQGEGAFMRQDGSTVPEPLRVSKERDLNKLFIGFAGNGLYRLTAACEREQIPRRCLRVIMAAAQDLALIASGRMDLYLHDSLYLWDCAAGDILLREAGAPGLFDYQRVPIFPHYLERELDGGNPNGFTLVATSSYDLFEEPARRILTSAGYQL